MKIQMSFASDRKHQNLKKFAEDEKYPADFAVIGSKPKCLHILEKNRGLLGVLCNRLDGPGLTDYVVIGSSRSAYLIVDYSPRIALH